jgi:hypothetical protein
LSRTSETYEPYTDDELDEAVARLDALARLMDNSFTLPGTNIRMGFDALLGLVPVIGDIVSQAISSYVIWEAKRLGVSRLTLWRMIGNSTIDTVVGFIPLVGDAFDVAFRSNAKNVALLKTHLEKKGYKPDRIRRHDFGPVIEGTATRID